jgi:anti-sigma regulatory factor (Ser/Thr protein kinase)
MTATAAIPAGTGRPIHIALFYRDEDEYQARAREFVETGLAKDQQVLIAVPRDHASRLRAQFDSAVRYLDMSEVGRNPGRLIPALAEFLASQDHQQARYFGEPIWPGRSAAEIREATRHEALLNLAFAAEPVAIMCPYALTRLPAHVIADACRTHPAILPDGQCRPSPRYAGPAGIPPGCERPLPPPPPSAEAAAYTSELRPLRQLVEAHARRAGLPESRTADLVLATSELTANTLRHTRAGGTLYVWHTSDEMFCEVRDEGWIFDPLVGRRRPPPEERGQGLWLVNHVCDLVELRSGPAGTTVRLRMRLSR